MSAPGDRSIEERHAMGSGDLDQSVCLGRPNAAHLQPDSLLGPIVEQRLDDCQDDLGSGQHRDHRISAAHHIAGCAGNLRPALRERLHMIVLTVPSDHGDTFVQQPDAPSPFSSGASQVVRPDCLLPRSSPPPHAVGPVSSTTADSMTIGGGPEPLRRSR
jgi:hypothetical protein